MDDAADDEQVTAPADADVSPAVATPDVVTAVAPDVAPDVVPDVAPARAGLTRVEIGDRVPEPAIDWCRHEVRRLVAGQLLVTAVVVAGVVVPAARWYEVGWAAAAPLGVAAGLAVAAARVIVVLVAAPLGLRYVRRFVAAPPEYVMTKRSVISPLADSELDLRSLPDVWELDDPALDEPGVDVSAAEPVDAEATASSPAVVSAGDALRELGLWPVAAVRTDGRPSSVVELFSDGDRMVAALDRTSGSITLLTELVGFRVLVTSALLVPPTDDLVVNVVDDDAPSALVVSHRRLVHAAFSTRALVSDPVGLFKLAQQRELEAYRQLGPFWGAMLDLRCRPGGVRLLSAPSAHDVLLCTGNRLFQQTH